MSNELELLDDDFVKIVKNIEKDILDTRYNIISKANKEVVNFYLRLGKIISDNAKYGNNFINSVFRDYLRVCNGLFYEKMYT